MGEKSLKDTYPVRRSGQSLQFTINPPIIEALNIREGEGFQVYIFQIKRKSNGEINNVGSWFTARLPEKSASKRITIKAQVAKDLKLEEGDLISVEISKFSV